MSKKTLYILSVILVVGLLSASIYFSKKNKIQIANPTTKTIIPETSYKMGNRETKTISNSDNSGTESFVELTNDEIFVDAISGDLNSDGVDDQIIAIKKLLDPFVYLIVSIQDPITQKRERIEEIRTTITQPKSLTFYLMQLENENLVLSYSGITSDNGQSLSLYTITKTETGLNFVQIADVHADIQVRLQQIGNPQNNNNLSSYKILTYNSDVSAPNTFNQIQTEYLWNVKTAKYEKGREQIIPGEKIESQLLRKLQTGNTDSFMEFLSELWYQNGNTAKSNRSIYLDKKDRTIIFKLENIEEIYEIKSILPRRYGLYFTTHNKSIPNIIRRVDFEIKGVDEIQVRVIEDVLRIKFGTASLWNGSYKKNINVVQTEKLKAKNYAEQIRKTIRDDTKIWKTQNGSSIIFNKDNKYSLIKGEKEETGYFTTITSGDKTILQLKTVNGINKFYLISYAEKNNRQTIILYKIKIQMNEIITTGDERLVFTCKAQNKE